MLLSHFVEQREENPQQKQQQKLMNKNMKNKMLYIFLRNGMEWKEREGQGEVKSHKWTNDKKNSTVKIM